MLNKRAVVGWRSSVIRSAICIFTLCNLPGGIFHFIELMQTELLICAASQGFFEGKRRLNIYNQQAEAAELLAWPGGHPSDRNRNRQPNVVP